jgi:hypothetical protein
MAPVQKLRDELAQKQPGNDRMRTLREAPTASS